MEKSWKLYESENSENLDDHLHRYILFQHSKVTTLEVLQDDVKDIFQKKHKELINTLVVFWTKFVSPCCCWVVKAKP